MDNKIIKLGGAATSKEKGFKNITEVLNSNNSFIVIVSAFGKTTRNIVDAAMLSESGNLEEALTFLNKIFDFHMDFVTKFDLDSKLATKILKIKNEAISVMHSISVTAELTPRILDKVMSFGELLALEIIFSYVQTQFKSSVMIDSREFMVTNNQFNNAKVLLEETNGNIDKIIKPMLQDNKIIITQGFVAATIDGVTTTMGIESSNLTTTILANAFNSNEIVIYSDVEGIRSIDPKIFNQSYNIPYLSYHDAFQASKNGLKLIYPEMIKTFLNINPEKTITYRSLINPLGEYTVISNNEQKISNAIFVLEHDNYIIETDSEKVNRILENAINSGNAFIRDLYLNSGRLIITSWEKFNLDKFNIEFHKKSILKIIFISENISKYISIINRFEIDYCYIDYTSGSISLITSFENAEKIAKYSHQFLIDTNPLIIETT